MPQYHLLFSLPIALLCYYLTQDIPSTLFFLAISVFIDSDHALDYIMTYKGFNLKKFLKADWIKDKIYFFFHSYEFLTVLALLFIITQNQILFGAILAISYHIFLDVNYYTFKNKYLFYFLLYRFANKFEKKNFCPN